MPKNFMRWDILSSSMMREDMATTRESPAHSVITKAKIKMRSVITSAKNTEKK